MHIVSRGGLAATNSFAYGKAYGGMVGVSLSNHFFSHSRIAETVQLGLEHCRHIAIVVVDFPERWNWPLKEAMCPSTLAAHCLRSGKDKKRGITRHLRQVGLADQVSLWSWPDIMMESSYKQNYSVLEWAYRTNSTFREHVLAQLRDNLGRKIKNVERRRKLLLSAEELDCLCHYLIEEIAGLLHLQFDAGHAIDFYHKPPMDIMRALYTNAYPEICKLLGYDWSRQGWVHIK